MKKIVVLLLVIPLFWACGDDDDVKPTIQEVVSKIETEWKFGSDVEMESITVSGEIFSQLINNSGQEINVRQLRVLSGVDKKEVLLKEYKNDFITVFANGGEWLDGKTFYYVSIPLVFEWTIVYNGETEVITHTLSRK